MNIILISSVNRSSNSSICKIVAIMFNLYVYMFEAMTLKRFAVNYKMLQTVFYSCMNMPFEYALFNLEHELELLGKLKSTFNLAINLLFFKDPPPFSQSGFDTAFGKNILPSTCSWYVWYYS